MYSSFSKDFALPALNGKLNIVESYNLQDHMTTLNDSSRDVHNISSLTQEGPNLYYKSRESISPGGRQESDAEIGSLSSFTRIRNYLVTNDIRKYNRSHNDGLLQKDPDKDAAKNLLNNCTRELRCLSYKLSTVVSDGNYHQVLEPGVPTMVEVIENTQTKDDT